MKKFVAVLCAAAMVAAVCVPALAADVAPGTQNSPVNPVWPPYTPPTPSGGDDTDSSSSSGTSSSSQGQSGAPTTNNNAVVNGTPVTVDTESEDTDITIPAGLSVLFVEAKKDDFPADGQDGVQAVIDLFNDGQSHTLAEILKAFDLAPTTLQSTPSNTVVGVDGLEIISKPLVLKFSNGEPVPNGKIKFTFAGNELTKGSADGTVKLLTVDPVNKVVRLADIKVDDKNNCTVACKDADGLQLLVKNS